MKDVATIVAALYNGPVHDLDKVAWWVYNGLTGGQNLPEIATGLGRCTGDFGAVARAMSGAGMKDVATIVAALYNGPVHDLNKVAWWVYHGLTGGQNLPEIATGLGRCTDRADAIVDALKSTGATSSAIGNAVEKARAPLGNAITDEIHRIGNWHL